MKNQSSQCNHNCSRGSGLDQVHKQKQDHDNKLMLRKLLVWAFIFATLFFVFTDNSVQTTTITEQINEPQPQTHIPETQINLATKNQTKQKIEQNNEVIVQEVIQNIQPIEQIVEATIPQAQNSNTSQILEVVQNEPIEDVQDNEADKQIKKDLQIKIQNEQI